MAEDHALRAARSSRSSRGAGRTRLARNGRRRPRASSASIAAAPGAGPSAIRSRTADISAALTRAPARAREASPAPRLPSRAGARRARARWRAGCTPVTRASRGHRAERHSGPLRQVRRPQREHVALAEAPGAAGPPPRPRSARPASRSRREHPRRRRQAPGVAGRARPRRATSAGNVVPPTSTGS